MITVRSVDGAQVPRLALAQFSFTSLVFLKWEKSGAHHSDGPLEEWNLVKHSSSCVEYKGFNMEGELIDLIRAWAIKKIWVPGRNRNNDLANTGRALYALTYENSWSARSLTDICYRRPAYCWGIDTVPRSLVLINSQCCRTRNF